MKRILAAIGCALLLIAPRPAAAASAPILTVNGTDHTAESLATLWSSTTYVSLRMLSGILDSGAAVSWEDGVARVQTDSLSIAAKPGDTYILVNGQKVSVPLGVKMAQDRVLVPVRTLAQAFGAVVYWNSLTWEVSVVSDLSDKNGSYSADDLYWLSRIISAESQGEPLEGKIAVGNVVLNRVASSDFPNTIYDVIFDSRWGGQFEPVSNGTIYQTPTDESILAARLCLTGANVISDCLYFLAPALAQNFWTVQNREYVATIGCHDFYR